MKKNLSAILFLLIFSGLTFGHPYKPNHFVIIDTDGGIDDMRTICMLLASPDTRILGITVSPGVLSAENAYVKVKSLLNTLHHEGIPIGITQTGSKGKDCEAALNVKWGDEQNVPVSNVPTGINIVQSTLSYYTDLVTFVCLASLKPIEEYVGNIPDFNEKIKKIIWSNNQILPPQGFNHELSPISFENIKKMQLQIEVVNGDPLPGMYYDEPLLKMISRISTPYAEKFNASFIGGSPNRFIWFDEMIAIYLHYPDLFLADTIENVAFYQLHDSTTTASIFNSYYKILSGETVVRCQVLRAISLDTTSYFQDVQPIMKETIRKYGKTEWISGVLANELHRHLGVYAIIGVKMGIRALEYFGAGIDEMNVVSHAGFTPPYSCMNDGIQVSTGATLGHGLIKVSSDTVKLPVADFTYMEKTIRITLNKNISQKISSEINELNIIYGLNSNIYWELVRQLAIKYWATFDRHSVFEIIEL